MLHNNIYYSDRPVLSQQFCDDLISKFEDDSRKRPGGQSKEGIVDTKLKSSTDIHISTYPGYENEAQHLKEQLVNELRVYKEQLEALTPVYYQILSDWKFPGFNMQRTLPGECYNWHSDEHVMNGTSRAITYIVYLNDIHHDGYTEFNDGTRIQPKRGHFLLFPAHWTHVHRGVPPISETKYLATGWGYYRVISTSYNKQNIIHPNVHLSLEEHQRAR